MTDVLGAVIRGLSFGSVYALLAVGLVLTYRTTGVFNLAFGPQAFLAAAVFYDTHITHHWPMYLALFFTVGVVSPAGRLVLDRGLFRYPARRRARRPSSCRCWACSSRSRRWCSCGSARTRKVERRRHRRRNGTVTYSPIHNVFVSRDDIAIIVTGLVVFVGLTADAALHRDRSADARGRGEPAAHRARRCERRPVEHGRRGCCRAPSPASPGVLLTPVFAGQVDYSSYETLVIAAIAAAVLGGLRSIPLAYAGGLGLGVAPADPRPVPPDAAASSRAACARRCRSWCCSLVLIFSPSRSLRRRAVSDPLAGVDPPPPAPAHVDRSAALTNADPRRRGRVLRRSSAYYLFFHANDSWVDLAVRAAILVDHLLVDHGHHRLRRPDLAVPGDVRGDRRVRDRAARDATRAVGDRRRCSSGRCIAARRRRAGRDPGAAARRHLPVARDARVRVLLRSGACCNSAGSAAGLLPIAAPRPLHRARSTSATATSALPRADADHPRARERSGDLGARAARPAGTSTRCAAARSRPRRSASTATAPASSRSRCRPRSRASAAASIASYERAAERRRALRARVRARVDRARRHARSRTVEGAINAAVGFVFFEAVVLPTWIPLLVNHVQPWYHMSVVAGGPAADPVRPRRAHLREAPRRHSRVPEAPVATRASKASSTASSGAARPTRRARSGPGGTPSSPRRGSAS